VSYAPGGRAKTRRPTLQQRRARLALLLGVVLVIAVALISGVGGSLPQPPRPQAAAGAAAGDPFGYVAAREQELIARATAGNAHVLFAKSPGGVVATAARVAAYRPLINRASAGTGIDPSLLEALVFVESAGRPDVVAGTSAADAAGLTQILAQTGQQLLGMHIDLPQSRRLTTQVGAVLDGERSGRLAPLLARLAAADDRFNPAKELAATVRYLRLAEHQFGREDLAFESYHMGIGNLHQVLTDYNGGRSVPYVQLYFDTAPDHHRTAYNLLAGFGDDSSLYYWRVLGAVQIMRLYRTDRSALVRLASLQDASDSGAQVLHPPDRTQTFSSPSVLAAAYQDHKLVPLPSNAAELGLAVNPQMGSDAGKVGGTPALYRGLRPVALRLLIAMAARVRALSGGAEPLRVFSTVSDAQYERQAGEDFPAALNGYSFQISRRYANGAQAGAFQAVLDRLQALNLIAWAREPTVIDVTVASDAGNWVR
jgi:soluble lytic murein transglycosylase-like protein